MSMVCLFTILCTMDDIISMALSSCPDIVPAYEMYNTMYVSESQWEQCTAPVD
jgi:hypothetical protein